MPLCLLFPAITKNKIFDKNLLNKTDNLVFVNKEDIPMVHHDDDYDDYKTPNTSRTDETSFIEHDTTEATSAFRLRQKVKRDKITVFYKNLTVRGDPGLADIDQFIIKRNYKER